MASRPFAFLTLLAISAPVAALLGLSNDLCGISLHQSDYPELPGFRNIEVGWIVPQLLPRRWTSPGVVDPPDDPPPQSHTLAQEVALCCGDDCSTRLSAGIVTRKEPGREAPASHFVLQFSPYLDEVRVDLPLGVGVYPPSWLSSPWFSVCLLTRCRQTL